VPSARVQAELVEPVPAPGTRVLHLLLRFGGAREARAEERGGPTAVLDAVVRVLKKHGVDGVTTNRIADLAGVSIGSHGAAYRRPQGLSLAAAKEEAVHAVLTYLRS
jgi:hypothetical protein